MAQCEVPRGADDVRLSGYLRRDMLGVSSSLPNPMQTITSNLGGFIGLHVLFDQPLSLNARISLVASFR
jgi:hypothetical protein